MYLFHTNIVRSADTRRTEVNKQAPAKITCSQFFLQKIRQPLGTQAIDAFPYIARTMATTGVNRHGFLASGAMVGNAI